VQFADFIDHGSIDKEFHGWLSLMLIRAGQARPDAHGLLGASITLRDKFCKSQFAQGRL
jgi:hypothetical protein